MNSINDVKTIELTHSGGAYDILIGGGLLETIGQEIVSRITIKSNLKDIKIGIISDNIVYNLYGGKIESSLKRHRFISKKFTFECGEAQKTLTTVNDIYNFLCENNFNRDDILIALGGGIPGDITGFAAATYLRGIKFIQVATTLLAQVDSSVGGKTGVNLPSGKNLVGAFYQPSLVICDTNTLRTLTGEIYADGMAELIKHGCILNRELFYELKNKTISETDMIYESIKIKADIVAHDERESKGGERIKLNFGHTLGHAIEKYYNFSGYTHGRAVAVGMVYAAKISYLKKLCSYNVVTEIKEILKAYELPICADTDIDNNALLEYCTSDKKAENSGIRFVLLTEIGKCVVQKISTNELRELLNKCGELE